MITGELKSKVDRIWDTMWSGGISNPLSVIEHPAWGRADAFRGLAVRHKAPAARQSVPQPPYRPALVWQ